MTVRKAVLERRQTPRQRRAEQTVETILAAAGRLLEEVGFEAISTNKVAAAAGMTPPALYRYFPNKYALLKELGERLMARQNAALAADPLDPDAPQAGLEALLRGQFEATASQPGGAWIMRALRASPLLAEVRLASHAEVAALLAERLGQDLPQLEPEALRRRTRLAVEFGYAVIEHLFEVAPERRDAVIVDAARFLGLSLRDAAQPG